jgi:hypothetical protein
VIPPVVAIERGKAQTGIVLAVPGLKDRNKYHQYEVEGIWKVTPQQVKVLYT